MIRILRDSLGDFRLAFAKYLSFELIYSFLASLLVVPFLSYLFNKIFMIIGRGEVLLNSDVYQIGMSFEGLMGVFSISFLAVAVLFVEFGVLIIVAQKSYFKHPVTVSQSLVTSVSRLPKLIGLGIFQLFFLLLLGIPFLDASTLPPLLDLNVTIILGELIHKSLLVKLLYLAIFTGVLYLYVRWIYALHFIFIENKSISKAMAASWRLTRHRKIRLVLSVVLLNLLVFALGFLIITLISQLATIMESKTLGDFIGNYLLTFSSYVALLFSLFLIPINMIILTRLYFQSLHEEGVQIRDGLVLRKAPTLRRMEAIITKLFRQSRGMLVSIAAISIAAIVLVNGVIQGSIVYLPWDVSVLGHRGDGYSAPENTVSSVKSGIEKGVDAVEIDVTLTKDDVLVLSHDTNLKRLGGVDKDIKDLTLEELKDIDIGSSFDESYAGERIPTLDEILDLVTEYDTGILIDVKTDVDEDIYAKEIARLVEKHDAGDLASVQSFNPTFLKLIRKENKHMDIGQILFLYAGNLSRFDVDFYTVRETMLTKRFVQDAKRKNRRILVWTVNSKRNMKKVLSYDIDGIITDYPERVQRVIGIKNAEERQESDIE